MGRRLSWALGMGVVAVLSAAPVSAQTSIDVGVWTPNVGGRVVIGQPRVVYAPPPRPVYVAPERVVVVERDVHDRGRHRGHGWGPRNKRVAVTRVYEVRDPYWAPAPGYGYYEPARAYEREYGERYDRRGRR